MSNNAKLTTYSELAEVLDQLPALVRAERRRRGVGRSQVAREIGVSSTLVARFEAGQGVLGIYDVSGGFTRIGEVPTHGVGPHEVLLSPDGRILHEALAAPHEPSRPSAR